MTIKEQEQIKDFEDLDWSSRREKVLQLRKQKLDEVSGSDRKEKLKKFKQTDPFIHLTRLERTKLLEDALDLVGEHEGLRLFGEAISKSHPKVLTGQIDPVKQAFEQVVTRFDSFLQRRHSWKLQKSTRPPIDNGLLILDKDYASESSIDKQFRSYRESGHPWGELKHVIDLPFFAASDKLSGLQLVDLCAYAVRRYLDKNAVKDSHEEKNFLRIYHRFDRNGMGKLHGLRHYIPLGTCSCLICMSRGHST